MERIEGALVVISIVVGLITLQLGVDRHLYQRWRRLIRHLPKDWQRWIWGESPSASGKTH